MQHELCYTLQVQVRCSSGSEGLIQPIGRKRAIGSEEACFQVVNQFSCISEIGRLHRNRTVNRHESSGVARPTLSCRAANFENLIVPQVRCKSARPLSTSVQQSSLLDGALRQIALACESAHGKCGQLIFTLFFYLYARSDLPVSERATE
jgi:hypothetical protein